MIKIAARLFDPLGYIEFQPLPSNLETTFARRVTRVATLDGESSIIDRGFSESDRTLVYRYKPVSRDHDERAQRLVKLHPTVAVATRDGLFEAAPQSFEPGPSENRITLFVIRKLSED
jgi:hypothetical protein